DIAGNRCNGLAAFGLLRCHGLQLGVAPQSDAFLAAQQRATTFCQAQATVAIEIDTQVVACHELPEHRTPLVVVEFAAFAVDAELVMIELEDALVLRTA